MKKVFFTIASIDNTQSFPSARGIPFTCRSRQIEILVASTICVYSQTHKEWERDTLVMLTSII